MAGRHKPETKAKNDAAHDAREKSVPAKALAVAERMAAAEKSANRPLTPIQLKYVEGIGMGMMPMAAAKYAGVVRHAQSRVSQMNSSLAVQRAIQRDRELAEKAGMMTKKRVMDGFLEAIDTGRLKADSLAMTSGWREIAKMCGYYEPTKHKITVSHEGQLVIQKLQSMNDDDLLKLADGHTDALEGEFQVIQADE